MFVCSCSLLLLLAYIRVYDKATFMLPKALVRSMLSSGAIGEANTVAEDWEYRAYKAQTVG